MTWLALIAWIIWVCAGDDLGLVRSAIPKSSCIELVLVRNDGARLYCGHDMGTGAWYRYQAGTLSMFLPGKGCFRGPPDENRLERVDDGRNADYLIERRILPFLYLQQILNYPDCVKSFTAPTGQVDGRIELEAPFGDPRLLQSTGPRFTVAVTIDNTFRVTHLARVDQNHVETLDSLGVYSGIPVSSSSGHGTWIVQEAKVRPPGTLERPCFQLNSVTSRMRDIRLKESREAIERAATASPTKPQAPDTAPIVGPTRRASGPAYRIAFFIAGIAVVITALAVWWWEHRR